MKKIIKLIVGAIVAAFTSVALLFLGFGAGIAVMVRKNCSKENEEDIEEVVDYTANIVKEKLDDPDYGVFTSNEEETEEVTD